MDFNEFLQFHQFKNSTVILHCEVETKEYKRFTRPFITDKHISVIQWEEIIRKTEQEICKYLKKSFLDGTSKGQLVGIEDLKVSFEFVPREQLKYLNYKGMPFEYKYEWIMKLKIVLLSSIDEHVRLPSSVRDLLEARSSREASAPKPLSTQFKSRHNELPSKGSGRDPLETRPSREAPKPSSTQFKSRYNDTPTRNSGKSRFTPSPKKKSSESRGQSSSKPATKNDPIVVSSHESSPENEIRSSKRLFSNDNKKDDENFFSKPHSTKKAKIDQSDKVPKLNMTHYFETKNLASSTPHKPQVKQPKVVNKLINPLGTISEEGIEKLSDFVAKSVESENKAKLRMEELKNLELWDCLDLSEDFLRHHVGELKPKVLMMFRLINPFKNCDATYNPVLMTTSNILSDNQLHFVCKEVEKLRTFDERGTCEDILSEKVLPEFIIHVFSDKYGLDRDEAIERLKLQDEYKSLFHQDEASF